MPFQKPGRGDPSSNTFGTADAPPNSSPATFGTADASSKSSSLTPPTEKHRSVHDLGPRQTGQGQNPWSSPPDASFGTVDASSKSSSLTPPTEKHRSVYDLGPRQTGQGQNPWPSPPDSGNNTRKPSPTKIHQANKDARPKSPPLPAGPIIQGPSLLALQSNPSYAFSGAGQRDFEPGQRDFEPQFPNGDGYTPLEQPGVYHPPRQGPTWLDAHPSRSNSRHSSKDTKESLALKSSTLLQAHSTPRSLPVVSWDARARSSSAQNQNSRLLTSAIQQFKANADVHNVSHPYDIRNEIAKEDRARRFNIISDYPAISQNQDTAVQGLKKQSLEVKKLFSGEVQTAREVDNSAEVEGTDLLAEKDWRSAEAILGVCPDMCPESERQERERKGDLDRLERLDGDRNQTSKDLAVKKYSRTAGKDSTLIRPLAVLLMTMEYLLHLLSRGYDEELLSLHNFLWDRMRAIRMDLRMQHIFNQQAVAMHEQMIRFHILAMHELCEYKKGEGFSEGFDAHLNIEQMNKTSVDLFHMYDDFRKAGHPCANEAEFRGYYALLKLDKHPGYLVEPAELSLDLAKMTPDMRNASEVQFARKVARACRSGNYLAFFRLTREATYLQACLMHAHFAKLRSQAMASLHSGLQKNQGIPIVQVEEWLAMEGEDTVALAEYHGFSLKNYEELYIVKEGPFLNRGQDFQARRSKIVEEKRSQIIRDDVLTSGHEKMSTIPVVDRVASFKKVATLDRVASFRREANSYATVATPGDEEMPDYVEDEQQNEGDVVVPHSLLKGEVYERGELQMPNIASTDHIKPDNEVEHLMFQGIHHNKQGEWFLQGKHQDSCSSFDKQQTSSLTRTLESVEQDKQNESYLMGKRKKQSSQLLDQENVLFIGTNEDMLAPSDKRLRFEDVKSEYANVVKEHKQSVEVDPQEAAQKWAALEKEANRGKLCLILRRWKLRAAVKAEERRWMLQKLDNALGSFHLGLPVQRNKVGPVDAEDTSIAPGSTFNLDIKQIESSRISKLENMWVGLDVSQIVAPILKWKNMASKIICWKILMCSGLQESENAIESKHCERNIASEWLRAKLLQHRPFDRENAEGLPSTIICQELVCVPDQSQMCNCLFFYIAKDVQCSRQSVEVNEVGQGANGLIFMLREGSPLNEERARLHEFVNMLQSGVQLPLLVLCSDLSVFMKTAFQNPSVLSDDIEAVAMLLGINDLDKTKIGAWTVLPISEEDEAKFSQSCSISLEGSAGMGRFFSEKFLREGLSWLSSRAPKQPNLRSLHIQDLVLEHLKPLIKVLSCMEPTQVTPDLCIQIFNEALMKSAKEISDTASSFNLQWPPNELWEILEEDSLSGGSLLPNPGWNESTSLQPVLEALGISQLPQFQLMSRGTNAGSNSLKSQRIALEKSLHRYVNQLLGSRPGDLLTLQMVHDILQKGCILKQTDGNCVLLPNWSFIFQHFYILRLALLKAEPPTVVYVFAREESVPDGLPDIRMESGFTDHMTLNLNDILEMEQQEAALLEREADLGYIMKNNGLSAVQKDAEVSLLEQIRTSEDVILDIFQAQPESVTSDRDVRSFISMIEHPIDEEIALQNLVDDYCRKVDQESAEAGKVEQHSLVMAHDGSLPNDDWHSRYPSRNCINFLPAPSKVSHYDEDCFSELLNRCEMVQKDIDKKLKEMGGIFL